MKGIFCISIDTELLWGRKDLDYSPFIERTKNERKIIRDLLKLFKKYNISATWAIVGKLKEGNDPLWSGKDIINEIKRYEKQEIASHSYSHEDFYKIDKDKAFSEFSKNKAFSFVFPRNHIAYLDLLSKSGFKAFRGKDKSKYELLIPRVPPTEKVRINKKLIEIPSSMYFVSARGYKKYIPFGLRFLKARLGINRAISQEEIFHIWFHPVDFADETQKLMREFEIILKYADGMRKEGKLEILTMREIAEK